jgi:hypothetical protein
MAFDLSRMQFSPCQDANPPSINHSSGPEWEPFVSGQRVRSVINPGEWDTALPCDIIQFPTVHTEAQVPILLDENNR